MKNVSIIIPIFNAERFLPDLFKSMDNCEYLDEDEILLVDNGSKDNTKELCLQQVKKSSRYKYLYFDEKADSYAARNYGVRNSTGEILVFTDSDCKPTAEWLSTIRSNIKSGTFIAGNILLEIVDNSVWECFDSITHLSQTKNNLAEGHVATANMAVLRDDFLNRVGFFEERFAGGDFEWSKRAVTRGMNLLFLENALVYHPSRKTYEEILTREKRSAYGAGKHYRIMKTNKLKLRIVYFLKIFKFDTYMKLAKQMKDKGIPRREVRYFVRKYFGIRFQQLGAALAGYEGKDPRKLGIK